MPSTLRALYLCYAPVAELLVHTQVLAYLEGLVQQGHYTHLLTFESLPLSRREKWTWRRYFRQRGVIWHHLAYHKRPSLLATVYDVLCGAVTGLKIMRRYRLQAVHARSHVPAVMGLILKQLTGCRLIFDMRGLLAEEYEDAGLWERGGLPFRLTKAMEKRCLDKADAVVVLTNRVKHELFDSNDSNLSRASLSQTAIGNTDTNTVGMAKDAGTVSGGTNRTTNGKRVYVIPCCVDLARIQAQCDQGASLRAQLALVHQTVMVYVGKLGGWYMNSEMVEFFVAGRSIIDNLHFLVVTQSDAQPLIRECIYWGLSPCSYTVTRSEPERVGSYLAAADFAISFRNGRSRIAASPTKVAEYWAAGLPVVCNSGVGDLDEIIEGNRVGVLLEGFTTPSYQTGARQILSLLGEETRQRCRETARRYASLEEVGIPRYHRLYREVAQSIGPHNRSS